MRQDFLDFITSVDDIELQIENLRKEMEEHTAALSDQVSKLVAHRKELANKFSKKYGDILEPDLECSTARKNPYLRGWFRIKGSLYNWDTYSKTFARWEVKEL